MTETTICGLTEANACEAAKIMVYGASNGGGVQFDAAGPRIR
jgi:hypothetical protein